jgi:hypothetical protein
LKKIRLTFLILYMLCCLDSSFLFGARRSETESGDNYLWWESLISLDYTINTSKWPNDSGQGLTTKTDYENAVVNSFKVWQDTGYVSFNRKENALHDPDACSCSDISNGTDCTSVTGCSWSGVACTGGTLFDCCSIYDSSATCPSSSCSWVPAVGCFHASEAPEEINVISNRNSNWLVDSSVLAHTVVWYYYDTGKIIDVDIVINDEDHNWDMGVSSFYNLQAVLVHEIGHLIGIAHPCTAPGSTESWIRCGETDGEFLDVTMYPLVSEDDDVKLITLESDDLLALQMVCADTKTLCHDGDSHRKVEVKQGGSCFYVDSEKKFSNGPGMIVLISPILLLWLIRKKWLKFLKTS